MSVREHGDDSASRLSPGTRVGDYEILAVLGSGGMGIVYRARDLELPREVALKCPRPEFVDDPEYRHRFVREARAAAQLSNPFVLPVFKVFEVGGVPWLAMELAEGRNLRDVIASEAPLPTRDALAYAANLAEALRAAHDKRILHRDVKPGNVMISPQGRARLMDFGLAGFAAGEDSASAPTRTGPATKGPIGTPQYMSPEQTLGRPLDARTDIFSLGAVIYEMCTGRPPFSASKLGDVRDAILHREPTAISRLNYEVPEELERIVRKAMAKDPDERYQNAQDLLVDLETLRRRLEHLAYEKAHPAPAARMTRWRAHPRGRAMVARGVSLAAAAGIAIALWTLVQRPRHGPTQTHRALPVVTWPTEELDARLSPDQKWISFVSNRDGPHNIWIRNVSGGDATRLTSETGAVLTHVWSPNGDEIAYVTRVRESARLQVVPAPLLGRARLRFEDDRLASPETRIVQWIGSTIYIERKGSLFGLDVQSSVLQRVNRNDPDPPRHFDIRADGNAVVFSAFMGGRWDLWTSRLDGSDRRRLTDDPHEDSSPRWLGPGGDRVVFVSDRAGPPGVWQLDLTDRSLRSIPVGDGVLTVDDVSEDASILTVSTAASYSNLWELHVETRREHPLTADRLRDDGLNVVPGLSRVAFQRRHPDGSFFSSEILTGAWSPTRLDDVRSEAAEGFGPCLSVDGRWLAFLKAAPGGSWTVVLKDLSTMQSRVVSDRLQFNGFSEFPTELVSRDVVWSPARSHLFFVAQNDSGDSEIRRLRVESPTMEPEVLAVASPRGRGIAHLCVSADGERLAYVTHAGPGGVLNRIFHVHELHVSTRENRVVFADTLAALEEFLLAGWLADGRTLVGLRAVPNEDLTQDLEVLRIDEPGARVASSARNCARFSARLDPQAGLLYVTRVDGLVHNVYAFSFGDHEWKRLTDNELSRVTYSSVLRADRDRLIYAREEEVRDIWMVRLGANHDIDQ